MIRCEDCGQRFGGQLVFDRHRLKREDRCLVGFELKMRGFYRDRGRVWHQPKPSGQTTLPGVARAGSTTVEKRIAASVPEKGPSIVPEPTPTQTRGGS